MKKLLVTFITGLIVACFCLLLPVIVDLGPSETPLGNLSNTSGANVVTPFDTGDTATVETVKDDDGVKYTFTAVSPGSSDPVIIGPNRQKTLQDGESLIMKFTVLSFTRAGNQHGMLLARRDGIPTSSPSSSSGAVAWYHNGAGGYTTTANNASSYTKAGATDSKGITNANVSAATIFASGNEVKAVFTPAQSETELGVFEISFRPAGTKEWISGVRASDLPTTVSRDSQIWFYFNGNGTSGISITDYSITTTHGANLLYSQDGKEAENANNCGTYIYDEIGMAFAYTGTTYSVKAEQVVSSVESANTTSGAYVLAPSVSIPEGEKLVQEFEIVNGFEKYPFQFGVVMYFATNQYMDGGIMFHRYIQFASATAGDSWNGTVEHDIENPMRYMLAGSTIRLEYTPYNATTEEKGSLALLSKSAGETEFTTRMLITGMTYGTSADSQNNYRKSVMLGLRMYGNADYPTQSYAYKNFVSYTEDLNSGVQTMRFNGTVKGVTGITKHGCTTTSTSTEVNVTVPEYSLTFGGLYFGRGVTDYVAYVKQGGSYTLPVKPYGIDGHFIHWSTSMGIKQGGAVVTPTGNINVTPVGIHFNMNSTAVNTYGAYGLQFGTLIDYDEYVALNSHNEENDITTGTIIVPASYVGTVALTLDALETSGKTYLNIVNDGFANAASVASGGDYEFYGAIVNILDKNLARDFVAVGYMSFEVGEYSYTLYTEVSEETSIYEVAKSAYATAEGEVKTKIAELYLDRVVEITDGAIVTADGYTSPYTIEGGKLVGENVDEIAIVIVDGTKKLAADSGYIA